VDASIVALTMRWNLTYGRIAYEAIWAQVFALATIWLLLWGMRRLSWRLMVLAALPFSLCLFTYVSYRLFALAVAAF
jgi:hypothetical protein